MKFIIALLLFFTVSVHAQFQISGLVKDIATNKVLPFATLSLENGNSIISDVDGKFNFSTDKYSTFFTVSYVGYAKKTIQITNYDNYFAVYLTPVTDKLKEIVVINENPANSIIRKVIDNKDNNNPLKKLSSFEFKNYNKLIITANPDSIIGRIELKIKKNKFKIDSSDYKFKRIISKQHLFLTEKVSQFQYSKPTLKETVLGTRMAGFKEPIYEFLGFNLQSFSLYDEKYTLLETRYKSPIAENAFKDYSYKILDTTHIESRKVIAVYFINKKKSKKNGLEGILYIDIENHAITKAIMRIRGVLDISATHEFLYIPEEKIWFPIKKNFIIKKGKSNQPISILGGEIEFEAETEKNQKNRKKSASDFTQIISESHSYDINYNIPINIKRAAIAVEVKDNANEKDELFWNKYRRDTLDQRSKRTFFVLDSLSIENKVEKRIRIGRKIINGFVPFGLFDLDLRQLFSYNNFEGFRFGLGGVSSELFSRKYRLEGYAAYGLKDEAFKFNLGGAVRVGKFSNSWIGASYTDDIREIASVNFNIDKRIFKLYDPRPINISTFYNHKTWRTYIETKIIPKTESIWQITHSEITPLFNYNFNLNGQLYSSFSMSTALLSLQWNPFSDFMQTPNGKIEIEKRFPKFTFQLSQTLPNFFKNDFTFGSVDFRTEYEKKYLNGQKTAILFQGGYIYGDAPITHLYNTSPNNLNKDNILQRITIAGKNSFETMYFNEFFSNEFLFLQLKHGFNRMKLFSKVKPAIILVSRMAWGNLEKPEQHIGIEYKTLSKGYLESGIEFNQIFKGFGLNAFYRYGPNHLPRFEDNIAVKLSYIFDFGF
jgi:hypothetical protein